MACKGWTNSDNALEQRLVVGEDTLLHIFLAAVAALTYPPRAAAITSTSTRNSGRENPATIINVEAGGGSVM
jgi:hypothetical protein